MTSTIRSIEGDDGLYMHAQDVAAAVATQAAEWEKAAQLLPESTVASVMAEGGGVALFKFREHLMRSVTE
jgi:riboflavin biosynthesis pyrimidine reductase